MQCEFCNLHNLLWIYKKVALLWIPLSALQMRKPFALKKDLRHYADRRMHYWSQKAPSCFCQLFDNALRWLRCVSEISGNLVMYVKLCHEPSFQPRLLISLDWNQKQTKRTCKHWDSNIRLNVCWSIKCTSCQKQVWLMSRKDIIAICSFKMCMKSCGRSCR